MDRVEYYLNIAKNVAAGSKCSRRKFGAIIVKDDAIVGTGYNGSARGTWNCGEDFPCIKDIADEPHNISYDYCPAIHAEMNAIINSDRKDRVGATMYLAPFKDGTGDRPCYKCRRKLLNAQIKDIWYIDKYGKIIHEEVSFYITLDNEWMEDKKRRAKNG